MHHTRDANDTVNLPTMLYESLYSITPKFYLEYLKIIPLVDKYYQIPWTRNDPFSQYTQQKFIKKNIRFRNVPWIYFSHSIFRVEHHKNGSLVQG